MPEVQYKVDLPAFTGRNVPIKEIAQAMGKGCTVCKGWTSTGNSQIRNGNESRQLK